MKIIVLVFLFCLAASLAQAQTQQFSINPATFDGGKFITRYTLTKKDFWVSGSTLFLRDGVTLPDNPPIFDAPDGTAVAARVVAKANVDRNIVEKALILMILDEFNLHAAKINAILDAMDAATTLADLKSRIALIPDYPTRTSQQLINALKNKIDSGAAD